MGSGGGNFFENAANDLKEGFSYVTNFGEQPPEMPKAQDPYAQERQAKKDAEERVRKEVGERGKGLSSTVLGGSEAEDDGALKKKRLLGE